MKRHFLFSAVLALGLSFYGCKNDKEATPESEAQVPVSTSNTETQRHHGDTSETSLDWNGQYKGTLPCADCEGIETTLTLKSDGTYIKSVVYLGKDDKPFIDRGNFLWNDEGTAVILDLEDSGTQAYFVGENRIWHLDADNNKITGDLADNYILEKNHMDYALENRTWILTELMGQEVTIPENQKEAFLIFNSEEAMVNGNNSCNNIGGSYELLEGNRIKLGPMRSTMMACPDMSIGDQLNQVLEKIDNYTVVDGVLQLNKARMAPLAKFKLKKD